MKLSTVVFDASGVIVGGGSGSATALLPPGTRAGLQDHLRCRRHSVGTRCARHGQYVRDLHALAAALRRLTRRAASLMLCQGPTDKTLRIRFRGEAPGGSRDVGRSTADHVYFGRALALGPMSVAGRCARDDEGSGSAGSGRARAAPGRGQRARPRQSGRLRSLAIVVVVGSVVPVADLRVPRIDLVHEVLRRSDEWRRVSRLARVKQRRAELRVSDAQALTKNTSSVAACAVSPPSRSHAANTCTVFGRFVQPGNPSHSGRSRASAASSG